jgi:hypothetical protein
MANIVGSGVRRSEAGMLQRHRKAGGHDPRGPNRFPIEPGALGQAYLIERIGLFWFATCKGRMGLPRFRGEVRSWDQGI